MCPARDSALFKMKSRRAGGGKWVVNGNAAGCTAQGSRYLSLQRVCDCSRRKTFPRKDESHCSSAPRQADLCSRGAPPSFCSHALNNFFYSSSLRVSAADSGPVSTSFCMFFVCFVFLQVQVQHFLCGLASTLKRNQIRTFLRALLSHTQQKKKRMAVPQRRTLLTPCLFV